MLIFIAISTLVIISQVAAQETCPMTAKDIDKLDFESALAKFASATKIDLQEANVRFTEKQREYVASQLLLLDEPRISKLSMILEEMNPGLFQPKEVTPYLNRRSLKNRIHRLTGPQVAKPLEEKEIKNRWITYLPHSYFS